MNIITEHRHAAHKQRPVKVHAIPHLSDITAAAAAAAMRATLRQPPGSHRILHNIIEQAGEMAEMDGCARVAQNTFALFCAQVGSKALPHSKRNDVENRSATDTRKHTKVNGPRGTRYARGQAAAGMMSYTQNGVAAAFAEHASGLYYIILLGGAHARINCRPSALVALVCCPRWLSGWIGACVFCVAMRRRQGNP